ncbi:MAG: HNH endonuclease [Chitinophagales bacterium]
MKEGQRLWTRDELILAINLYCKLTFGKMHNRNPQIQELAKLIHRTPGSIAFKLGNFAHFDPTLKARGIGGLPNASKLDGQIWNEFYNNWDAALIESEKLLAKKKNTTIEKLNHVDVNEIFKVGMDNERMVKVRVNQIIFRTMILANYNYCCCITGISNPELLIASHILPWSFDEKNRLNPMNGLALNALHDRAFDNHLITVDADTYKIKVSSKLKTKNAVKSIQQNFLKYEGKEIFLPDKFLPEKQFLRVHNSNFIS